MKSFGKYILVSALLGASGLVYAQDSYDAYTMTNSDLNGTARFISMGGALGALGGDISVMSTNPAGTGMYRKSDAAVSFSGVFAGDGAMGHDGSRMSLDQGGVLIAFDMDEPTSKGLQYVNFGVNYQKKRNFLGNHLFDVQNLNGVLSQTFQIADLCDLSWKNDYYGSLANMSACVFQGNRREGLLYESYYDANNNYLGSDLFSEKYKDENGNLVNNPDYLSPSNENNVKYIHYAGIGAEKAYYERATFGANVQADLNLSFNVSDQFFIGASVGVYDIDYSRESFYQEKGVDGYVYDFTNWYKTTGDGFDVKLGFICRPIEESPFRIGAYVHTPTWYRMTDANGAQLYMDDAFISDAYNSEYDYRFRTPWKFGFSLGHTIGNQFAIGAEYEFQDLSTTHYGDIDGHANPYFRNTNAITKEILRGQHTLKVGAEFKPVEAFSIRVGYNFVSSPFKSNAFRTVGYDYIYTETDYTNWKAINRFAVGLGYRYKSGYVDLAWQYQAQKGDFYAFDNENLKPTSVSANRSQLLATFGFRF
ncbi:MAG: hypothetical protein J5616_06465 [Bacteroidaceae bacterium]|nr:hypothetical protein [Bacteroidaceae bacterium]